MGDDDDDCPDDNDRPVVDDSDDVAIAFGDDDEDDDDEGSTWYTVWEGLLLWVCIVELESPLFELMFTDGLSPLLFITMLGALVLLGPVFVSLIETRGGRPGEYNPNNPNNPNIELSFTIGLRP